MSRPLAGGGRLATALAVAGALAASPWAGGCGDEEQPAGQGDEAPMTAAETGSAAGSAGGGSESNPLEPPAGDAVGDNAASAGDSRTGGEEGPSAAPSAGAAPPASAEDAIRGVLTGAGSPEEACGSYVTDAFLRDAYGGADNCLASRRPRALARSVEIAPSGPGRYTVVPDGGTYDGVEIEIRILELDGAPLVDSLRADIPAGP